MSVKTSDLEESRNVSNSNPSNSVPIRLSELVQSSVQSAPSVVHHVNYYFTNQCLKTFSDFKLKNSILALPTKAYKC